MRKIWENYNLSIVLAGLFLVSWICQAVFQWQEYVQNAEAHKEHISVAVFMPEFFAATFENWQSEFLQLFTFVVLTTFLVHKGSHESKDSDDEMQTRLSRIEKLLQKR